MKRLIRSMILLTTLALLSAEPVRAQQPHIGSRYEGPPSEPARWPEPTHYISPQGDDSSSGASPSEAWRTFDHALPQLRPGDVLAVMDGTYKPSTTGLLGAHCGNGGATFSGAAGASITVRAVNERQPLLESDGKTPPVEITHCRNWNVLGLTALGKDRRFEGPYTPQIVAVSYSRNVALKRMLAVHSNRLGRNGNNSLLSVGNSSDVIVEESEIYEHHRHGLSGWKNEHVTFRRNYINPRDHWKRSPGIVEDPELVEPGSPEARTNASEGLSFYRTSWSLAENNIIEGKSAGFQSHGGDTFSTNPGGSWNHFLGNIALRIDHSRFDARRHPYPQAKPARGLLIKNHVVAEAQGRGRSIWLSSVTGARVENVTTFDGADFGILAHQRGDSPSCKMLAPYGGCSVTIRNALSWDNAGEGIRVVKQDAWRVSHSNAYANGDGNYSFSGEETIGDDEGHIRHSMSKAPTGMGLGEGECLVFVPEDSNMSGAGKDGADIGANVLYRYEDGELTDEPLWDAQTGAFPHGAVIDSLNGREAGPSLATIQERLNVNTHGCRLPYATYAK